MPCIMQKRGKVVLIQSGTSADKTFMDNFWTAHTYALAMADVQTGQVISDRCAELDIDRERERSRRIFQTICKRDDLSDQGSRMERYCTQ